MMKKLLVILSLTISIDSICQDRVVEIKFKPTIYCSERTYINYAGTISDTLTVNQDSISYEFYVAKPIAINYAMHIDYCTTKNCEIKYQGSNFRFDWDNIPKTSIDKKIYYRYIRILVIHKGYDAIINNVYCKLYYDCIMG